MLGITDNPKFNPMFKQTDEVLEDVFDTSSNPNSATIAEFYSPLESAIDNAAIGKQGTRGENIEAFVRKRAPKVTQAELDYREFSLDPDVEYTRGLAKLHANPLSIKALRQSPEYEGMQRQSDLLDNQVGYEEIAVDIIGPDLGLMTHYGPNNLAHARYSLRKKRVSHSKFSESNAFKNPDTFKEVMLREKDIKSYILIEELQSDVIQNMTDDPAKVVRESIANFKLKFDSDIDDIAFKREFEMPGNLFEEFDDFVFNELIPIGVNKKLTGFKQTDMIRELFEKRGYKTEGVNLGSAVEDMFKAMAFDKINVNEDKIQYLLPDTLNKMNRDFQSAINKAKVSVSKKEVPINKLTDSVRVLLQSIIADSKAKGIDEIVLPPIEKLAEKRFGTNPDGSPSKAYIKAITKGSGFHNTYVVAYDKALKQLQAELGNQIKVGTKDLNYAGPITTERITTGTRAARKKTKPVKGKPIILQGISINIKDLKLDPKKSKLRLNKGGLVQRPDR